MKKLFLCFVLLVQLFVGSFAFAQEPERRAVRVGVYENYPKIYRDTDGTIQGFWADIVNAIAQKEHWELNYVYDTWDNGLAKLRSGEIDMLVDVAVTDERRKEFDFNKETALLSWSVVYTRKGFDMKSFDDLAGHRVAVMQSSVHYSAPLGLKNILASFDVQADIIDMASFDDIFAALDANRADAGVVGWYYGIANESKYAINRTGIIFNPSELNFAFPKNAPKNQYLINIVDADLHELKNQPDGVYHRSIEEHFGKFLGEVQVFPVWLTAVLVGMGTLLLIVLAALLLIRQYNKTLQREIDRRIREIKENEEKYAAVVNQAHDGIVIVQDQVLKFANKAMEILGYPNEEVVGKSFLSFIAPEEQGRVVENYKKRMAGETVDSTYETKLAHKNGSIIDVEISSGLIHYGDKPADMAIIRDITGRKKMENEIKLRNTILATELEVALDGVLVVDGKGKIILYNRRFVDMWNIPKDVIDSHSDDLAIKTVLDTLTDPKEFTERIAYLYAHPKESDRSKIILKDGRTFDRYSAPMVSVDGQEFGRVWYFRDITEDERVEARQKEIDALKSKFIKIVSHQLRTPLGIIRWNLESLVGGSFGKLTEEQSHFLQTTHDVDVEVIDRVSDLLIALDIEEGRVAFVRENVSLHDLLLTVVAEVRPRWEAKHINWELHGLEETFPLIPGDPQKIRLVFEKLIDNAVSYTPENGRISVSLRNTDTGIRFEIVDTGIGIPTAEQKNIYKSFFRATNAFLVNPDASGVGLAIAKYFVEQHHGKIGFISEQNKGSTFWFELPAEKNNQ